MLSSRILGPRAFRAGLLTISLGLYLTGACVEAQEPAPKLVPFASGGRALEKVADASVPGGLWRAPAGESILTFKPADGAGLAPPPDGVSYLSVSYPDRGYARLAVSYKNAAGIWAKPDKLSSSALLDSGRIVTAYARCPGLAAANPEIKVGLEKLSAEVAAVPPLAVSGLVLGAQPPADEHFRYLLAEDWKYPYRGPAPGGAGNSTLVGKVMVGYQGWFRTPNDPYANGWSHWGNIARHEFGVDMWPNPGDYPPEALDKAMDVKTRSGKTAYLFSSAWPEVVHRHFAWMKQFGIDGAFLQRFLVQSKHTFPGGGESEWVLGNVRDAANREGRIWAVEYDVSGLPDAQLLPTLRNDWTWLVDGFGVRQDRSYAHEDGKPVVFVWGMSLPSRHISVATANAVVDFLKNDPKYGGNYVVGGISGNWRALGPEWQDHFRRLDCALSWQSKKYQEDEAGLRALGVPYYPMVWPGSSWANAKHLPTNAIDGTPRAGGQFYEGLMEQALRAGAQRLFVGMFDEYNESTAIMPMSDDPPATNHAPGAVLKVYNNEAFEADPVIASVPRVDLPLDGNPPVKNRPGTRFSLRYDGQILAPATGLYTFVLEGVPGDTARLSVGEKKVDAERLAAPRTPPLALGLTAGAHVPYRLDYRHGMEPGRLRLLWDTPGVGGLEPVPASAFVDDWGKFLTNEGLPPDYYLALTGKWQKILAERVSQENAGRR